MPGSSPTNPVSAPIARPLADDSAQIRRGLTVLFALADDIEVIAEAADGVEAVALAAQMMPDVVVMDLVMPVMDGIETTRLIRAAQPSARASPRRCLAVRSRQRARPAPRGFVLKDADRAAILGAVRSLA